MADAVGTGSVRDGSSRLSDMYDAVVDGVGAAAGRPMDRVPTIGRDEGRLRRAHKLVEGGVELMTETDGFSVHAFTEDIETGAKDARMLFSDCDVDGMVAFLSDALAPDAPVSGPSI